MFTITVSVHPDRDAAMAAHLRTPLNGCVVPGGMPVEGDADRWHAWDGASVAGWLVGDGAADLPGIPPTAVDRLTDEITMKIDEDVDLFGYPLPGRYWLICWRIAGHL